uniref:Uncharacterized protein n=1 Tax=Anguilla anguilla TaxID=7936 RepID=A0A0E9X7V6_ANGAN
MFWNCSHGPHVGNCGLTSKRVKGTTSSHLRVTYCGQNGSLALITSTGQWFLETVIPLQGGSFRLRNS